MSRIKYEFLVRRQCVNPITVISRSYLTIRGDIVMYDVRGMIGMEWKARSKFDRCGIPYQRYIYWEIYLTSIAAVLDVN